MDLFEQAKPYLVINDDQIKLTNALRTARGQRFGKLLKEAYYSLSPQLATEAKAIIQQTGELKIRQIVELAIKFNLHLKHCIEFLEEPIEPSGYTIPAGTWIGLESRGIKPMKLRQEVLDKMRSHFWGIMRSHFV